MRITGGILAGRQVKVPDKGVRPTTDRVREALFSMLAPEMAGARFLDIFAGSGVVGLEAWSRGADHVCWVEADRRTSSMLRKNAEALGLTRPHVVTGRVESALKHAPNPDAFDIVFADAPYGWETERVRQKGPSASGGIPALVETSDCLTPAGLLIVERASDEGALPCPAWTVVDHRAYGGSALTFYRKDTVV
jgi:16S rRNA (guanine966-N2)-methyltransferase